MNPDASPSGVEEPGVQGGVHPQILTLTPMSDDRDDSQSSVVDVESNDVIIDISQTR